MILSYLMYIFFSFREEQKHLKRASVVIGVIATVIFLLCVAMVAVTLHFTPVMNQLASKYPFLIFLKILLRIKIGWKYSELKKYTLVISQAW